MLARRTSSFLVTMIPAGVKSDHSSPCGKIKYTIMRFCLQQGRHKLVSHDFFGAREWSLHPTVLLVRNNRDKSECVTFSCCESLDHRFVSVIPDFRNYFDGFLFRAALQEKYEEILVPLGCPGPRVSANALGGHRLRWHGT